MKWPETVIPLRGDDSKYPGTRYHSTRIHYKKNVPTMVQPTSND